MNQSVNETGDNQRGLDAKTLNKLASFPLQPGRGFVWEVVNVLPLNRLAAIYSLAGRPLRLGWFARLKEYRKAGMQLLHKGESNFIVFVVIYGLIITLSNELFLTNFNPVISIIISNIISLLIVLIILPIVASGLFKQYKK